MNQAAQPEPRRWSWKRPAWVAIIALAVIGLGAVLLPALLTEGAARQQVESALARQLGRPVTVASARFEWGEGLTVTDLRVGPRPGTDDGPLATASSLTVRFNLLDLPGVLTGGDVPLDTLRVNGLELWLVVGEDGHTNVEDMGGGGGEAPRVRTIQISEATVHVENRRLGRTLTLENVFASVGKLISTGRGYASVSGNLRGENRGEFVVTANLAQLDLTSRERPVGSFKAEWTHVAGPDVWAVVAEDTRLARCLGTTSGRMSVSLGKESWAAEGAIQAAELAFALGDEADALKIPKAIVGFRLRQASADEAVHVDLLKFSAPGIDAKTTAALRLQKPDAAGEPALRIGPLAIAHAKTDMECLVAWGPLSRNVPAVKQLLEPYQRLDGRARLRAGFVTGPDGPEVTASVDLTDTVVVREGIVRKGDGERLRLELEALCRNDFASAEVQRLELIAEAGRAVVTGRVPLVSLLEAADGDAEVALSRRLAGMRLEAQADVQRVEALRALAPGLGTWLGRIDVTGPITAKALFAPDIAADTGPDADASWIARFRADLTAARVAVAGGADKPADKVATLEAVARVVPDVHRMVVQRVKLGLDRSVAEWTGSARIDWPQKEGEQPVGRFEGTLTVSDVASAGAVVAPGEFAAEAPVSGGATFNVDADLAEGRLRTHMVASLAQMAVRAGGYFAKPMGQPASLDLETGWRTGAWNRLEADAKVDVPGAHLEVLGDIILETQWRDLAAAPPAAGAAPPGPSRKAVFRFRTAPGSTLKVEVDASDLARAADLSPALKAALKEYRVEGQADGHLRMEMHPRLLRVTAGLDLGRADLDLGPRLKKPAGCAMTVDLSADVTPPVQGPIRVDIDTVTMRLGESEARGKGQVLLNGRALASPLSGPARVAALLEEADLTIDATWDHDAELRRVLPWTQPLYEACGLAGPTIWKLALAGTPTRGRVRLDVDATDCRISSVPTPGPDGAPRKAELLKAAGTAAAAKVELRYGEVPGEMILDRVALQLADATADAEGRLLFDDPRLVLLEPPTAWALHAAGRLPDAGVLASLLPSRLADLEPAGAVTVDIRAASDTKATQLESCQLHFDNAQVVWLGKPIRLNGPLAYDHQRLATDGLDLVVGNSDVTLTAYIADPKHDPAGSVFVKGKRLDVKEVEGMIRETSAYLASRARPPAKDKPPAVPTVSLSDRLARRVQQLLAEAHLTFEVGLDRVTLEVPEWHTTYDLLGLEAEARLAERHFVMSRFGCAMNQGTITGEMVLDFGNEVPVLSIAYDARNLHMADNLKPFIDSTFPGMQVFGTISSIESFTQRLEEGAFRKGRGQTVLTDGLLEGQGAPAYMTRVLPGLKLTQYPFNRMSNVFEHKGDGTVNNQMLFDGKAYDIYIEGSNDARGRTSYTLGVDLSVALGSKVLSRTLGQGKLPMMYYTGRIAGTSYAEGPYIRYVLPHEFMYDVFIRKNLLLQVIQSLGEKEPEIERPPILPGRGAQAQD